MPTPEDINEDWIKFRTWDLPTGSVDEVMEALGVPPERHQEEARRLITLPAFRAAPTALKRELIRTANGGPRE